MKNGPVNKPNLTVIVTGAGGGLGRGISHRLLRDGFSCVLADRDEVALQETLALAEGDQAMATAVVCDLCSADERRRLIGTAVEQPGTLYGLVNNAGFAVASPFFDENLEEWRTSLAINLEAPFFLAQAAIEHMRTQRQGRIINIASVYGIMAFNNEGYGARAPITTANDRGPVRQSGYAASKGGLVQLTQDLAATAGRWGITVNAISPGTIPHGLNDPDNPIATEPDMGPLSDKPRLGDRIDPSILDALATQVPLGRVGRVREIAGPVSFLLSEDASYITGVNLIVDGGWSIW